MCACVCVELRAFRSAGQTRRIKNKRATTKKPFGSMLSTEVRRKEGGVTISVVCMHLNYVFFIHGSSEGIRARVESARGR